MGAEAARSRFDPPRGQVPSLQFCRPSDLRIDPAYQRDVANGPSKALIHRIAQAWNWDLCQPLMVARRRDFIDRLFVIDGQHRLEAARLRGDIDELPCFIVSYDSPADEAAGFVALNQQRRPLSRLELFRAAVASGDSQAGAIMTALADAGLSLAPHTNYTAWKPGMVSNIAGIEASWRRHGAGVTKTALRALAQAFAGQVLQYAGTLFPGIAAVCADEMAVPGGAQAAAMGEKRFEALLTVLVLRSQQQWRSEIARVKGDNPDLKFAAASEAVLRHAWGVTGGTARPAATAPPLESSPPPLGPTPRFSGAPGEPKRAWCDQCEMRVTEAAAASCRSRFCSLTTAKGKAA